ncbi:MAG: hypothetical protein ACI4SK_03600 [Christensenellales bacterium]
MKKKLLIFLTVLLVAMTALSIVACSDYVEPEDKDNAADTITRTQIVTNGTFYNASSTNEDDYIKTTVSDWTATKGSLATTANGVAVGVIDLKNTEAYNLNKDKFFAEGNVTNPGVDPATPFDTDDNGNLTEELQDTNALVIASKATAGSVYYKNKSSFTLDPGKYYLLQYSVATKIDMTDVEDGDKSKKGAWVHITGGVEYVDSCINTDGEWETHYLYIETNKNNSTTLDIRLWLGNGPETVNKATNAYATKGVAFFDNIICKEVTSAKDAAYNDGAETTLNHDVFTEMANAAYAGGSKIGYESAYYLSDVKLEQMTETTPTTTNAINYYYSFREGVYTSSNTKNLNMVKGKSGIATSEQPTVTNAFTGIVDISRLYAADATAESKDTYSSILSSSYKDKFFAPSYEDWTNKIMTGTRNMNALDETKALMIYHSDLSALGFTEKTSIKIESNKNYSISVWVYVWAPEKDGVWVWPTEGKPDEPAEYSDAQAIIVNYYKGVTAFPATGSFEDYIKTLTDEEKEKIATAPATVTDVDAIQAFVQGDDVKTAMIAAGYDEKVVDTFRWLYVYENFDAFVAAGNLAAGDANYVEYRHLSERNTFVGNAWKELSELIQKHDAYDEEYLAYMAKYNVWDNVNANPYAKVKLTGAGEDLEKKTETCNEGWEKLTFYVQGNQLSDRNLTLEFWFGEGTSTEYENLMFGGAFFDNVEIIETEESDIPMGETWSVLSPLTDVGELSFGGLINSEDTASYWNYELADADKMSSGDMSNISLTTETEDVIGTLNVGGSTVNLRQLIYTHAEATASVLSSVPGASHDKDIEILPNKAYRFAIRVKTSDIEEGKGVTINLMGGTNDDEEKTSVASISNFNSSEWKEVVFYVMGDSIETNYVGIKITIGSGSRFDTSNYVKGSVYLAVANCTEIKYSEYNASTKSGDEVKSYSFANTASASESVTNGSFSLIDYSATDEKEFDANGKLTGIASTSSWTKGTAITNTYNKVELSYVENSTDNYTLKWAPVVGVDSEGNDTAPSAYEVYARFVEGTGTDAKTVERLYALVDKDDAAYFDGSNYSVNVDMTGKKSASFRVRGVGNNAVGAYSSYKTLGVASTGDSVVTEASEVAGKKEVKAGTVSKEDSLFSGSDYKSPYNTLLKISSNYGVGMSMTSASKTLNANTYYCVSVWVMTEAGTKAAVTVSNLSKVLTADVNENYIGYTGIDTAGKWTQYCFYIKTGASSSSFKLELSLGNPYAVKTSKKSDKVTTSVATYKNADLSSGTVYFDSVRVFEVKEKEFNDQIGLGEYNPDNTVKLHDFPYLYDAAKNQYAIRKLVYTVDSFDSFDENDVEEGKDGYNLGHTPNNYEWAKASDATGTTEKERLYGVYNVNMNVDKLQQLYMAENTETNTDENVFAAFMPSGFDIKSFITMQGYNSLVMSNKVPFGQSYTTTSSSTISSKSYYKLSFKAKALLAVEEKDEEDNKTYKTDGVSAEFRFMQTAATDKYQSIKINGVEEKEYSIYVYNPSSSSSTAKWAFYLGANKDDKDETGTKQLVMGMLVIDQVSLTTIDEDTFAAQKAAYDALDDAGKAAASSVVYSYDEDKPAEETPEEPEENPEAEKQSVWDRGDVWLLVSSLVIAVIIIVVVVVVVVKRWKKKHPKEVIGENVAKTEKEIKVVDTASSVKEDIDEDEEYSDKVKPVYVQRVVRKGKKKKNKK